MRILWAGRISYGSEESSDWRHSVNGSQFFFKWCSVLSIMFFMLFMTHPSLHNHLHMLQSSQQNTASLLYQVFECIFLSPTHYKSSTSTEHGRIDCIATDFLLQTLKDLSFLKRYSLLSYTQIHCCISSLFSYSAEPQDIYNCYSV